MGEKCFYESRSCKITFLIEIWHNGFREEPISKEKTQNILEIFWNKSLSIYDISKISYKQKMFLRTTIQQNNILNRNKA